MTGIWDSGGYGRSYKPGAQYRNSRIDPDAHPTLWSGKPKQRAGPFGGRRAIDGSFGNSPHTGARHRPAPGELLSVKRHDARSPALVRSPGADLRVWKLKRDRDPGVIGRPEARWRSVSRVLSDDICTAYQESATEKDEINPAVEYGNEIQEISGLTAGRDAANTRFERSVLQSGRDQVVVRYAAAITR